MATQKIGASTGGLAFDHWRAGVRASVARHGPQTPVGMVRGLVPRRGDFPDFITPAQGLHGLGAGLEAIARTPVTQLRSEIEFVAAQQRMPSWVQDLASGSQDTMRELTHALQRFYDTHIASYWPVVRAHADADRAMRARAFLNGGCEGLLDSFRPMLHWARPILEADYPVDWDVHLEGRGLVLVPCFFCWGNPVTLIDRDRPTPVVIYPVDHDLTITAAHAEVPDVAEKRLAALVGRTRGRLLTTLADMHSTGELARRFDLSPATVSQHISVLRDAGLVVTRRDATAALHCLTSLGAALCNITL